MKKTYQNPEMKIVNVQTTQLMAGSPDGFNSTKGTTKVSGSAALGRGGSYWDDEDEE